MQIIVTVNRPISRNHLGEVHAASRSALIRAARTIDPRVKDAACVAITYYTSISASTENRVEFDTDQPEQHGL